MTGFLLTFLFIMIVTIVIIETVSVRVIYHKEFIIQVNFFIFELILYPSRNRKPRQKRGNRSSRIRRSAASVAATRRALEYLFSRSRVTVTKLDLAGKKDDEPARLAIASQRSRTIITLILAYIALKSESLVTENPTMVINDTEGEAPLTIDVSLESTLPRVISSFVIYILNARRYRRKRRRKIV